MVTTIKITCDGVFIQTNSNRIHTSDNGIMGDSSMNIINNGNNHITNGHTTNNFNKTSSETTKNSVSIDDDIDDAPQSLPNLSITNSQPVLISPQLVKTLSRIKKTTSANCNKIVDINGLSPSSVTVNKSIHKVNRIDKNGQCTTSITSDARQWDGCTSKTNGAIGTVRRRNTFKNYLIECKENIVRRLSSSASPIG